MTVYNYLNFTTVFFIIFGTNNFKYTPFGTVEIYDFQKHTK